MVKNIFSEDELLALFSISAKITAIRDKKDMLNVIGNDLKKLIPFDDIAVLQRVDDLSARLVIYQFGRQRQKHAMYALLTKETHDIELTPYIKDLMRSEEPYVLNLSAESAETKISPPYLTFLLEAGLREQVAIGLNDSSKTFGIVVLLMERQDSLTKKHLQLFRTITRQLSLAFENVVNNEEILKREKEKTIFLELNLEMSTISDKDSLQAVIAKRVPRLVDFDCLAISLLDKSAQKTSPWFYHFSQKALAAVPVEGFPMPDLISDLVFAAEQPLIFQLDDLINMPLVPEYIRLWHSAGIREVVAAAMRAGDKNTGLLFLMNRNGDNFNRRQLSLLQGITAQIAIAIAHLTAKDEIAKKEYEKSILLNLNYEFAAIRDRDGLSKLVSGSLQRLFSFDYLSICVLNRPDNSYALFTCQLAEKHGDHPDVKKMENRFPLPDVIFDVVFSTEGAVILRLEDIMNREDVPAYIRFAYSIGARELIAIVLNDGMERTGVLVMLNKTEGHFDLRHIDLLKGIVYQVAMSVANIIANEKIGDQLTQINQYKEQLEDEKLYLQEEINTAYNYNEIIGRSPEMQKVFRLVSQVAFADTTVLLLGDTGTGKELIARAIHNASPRKNKVMMKVNCAAIPANLMESELFGHEKGSFTGADERRVGKFELANNSTIFLDEIGELSMELQAKLLRVLQEKEIERLGGKNTIKVNIRIIAATNRNLMKEVQAGRFRSDLYYRLNVFPILLPALKNRKEDIPVLTSHFIAKYARKTGKDIKNISHRVMKEMNAYNWPGNVRELEHLIERSVLLTNGPTITEIHLPQMDSGGNADTFEDFKTKTIRDVEKEHIIAVLKKCKGRVSGPNGAAKMLGIPASTLFSKMEKLGIQKAFDFNAD